MRIDHDNASETNDNTCMVHLLVDIRDALEGILANIRVQKMLDLASKDLPEEAKFVDRATMLWDMVKPALKEPK